MSCFYVSAHPYPKVRSMGGRRGPEKMIEQGQAGRRFRKLLVRYKKLERSFFGLNQRAAAIIAFRKIPLKVNITYG